MKLSTGKKVAFPIEFDNGDKDVIYFDPTDPDLGIRLINIGEKLQTSLTETGNNVALDNTGEMAVPKTLADVKSMSDSEYEAMANIARSMAGTVTEAKLSFMNALDEAFNSSVSTVLFKHCSPFAVVNGSYYAEQVLDALMVEIQSYLEKEARKSSEVANKHLKKYMK